MTLTVDIQSATADPVPEEDDIRRWIAAALAAGGHAGDTEVSVRLVDIRRDDRPEFNAFATSRSRPTCCLSPADLPPALQLPLLGDIVICAPVIAAEAAEQGKAASAHWAHMLVHGTLHLLGHDHMEAQEAAQMESMETRILAELGFPCPYRQETFKEHAAP